MSLRFVPVLLLALAIGCSGGEPAPEPTPEATPVAKPKPTPPPTPEPLAEPDAALLDVAGASATAPDTFTIKFVTSEGDMLVDVTRAWAPNGADRIYNLVKIGYFNEVAFFRVIQGFMAQTGIHGHPKVAAVWRDAKIEDDPVVESNKPGYVSFATAGPNTRTTQFFVNFGDNTRLDGMGFAPFGKLQDVETLNKLYAGYGEGAPMGRGPDQGQVQRSGNSYLKARFPDLDYIKSAEIVGQ
jgi:peptidyl-prolyl cis-trans isomerase A (cyclophilin A)